MTFQGHDFSVGVSAKKWAGQTQGGFFTGLEVHSALRFLRAVPSSESGPKVVMTMCSSTEAGGILESCQTDHPGDNSKRHLEERERVAGSWFESRGFSWEPSSVGSSLNCAVFCFSLTELELRTVHDNRQSEA